MNRLLPSFLLFFTFSGNYAIEDQCSQLSCSQLVLNGWDKENHECYDHYYFGCKDVTLHDLLEMSSYMEHKPSKVSYTNSRTDFNNIIANDERVKVMEKAAILSAVDTIYVNPKNYHSVVVRIPQKEKSPILTTTRVDPNNADIAFMNQTFLTYFSKQRNYQYDAKYKELVQKAVIDTFVSYGLEAEVQKFQMNGWSGSYEAKNLIGILPSTSYGEKGDRIFIIGGHYDTVYENPGVDDNGSGSVLVMESARLLSKYKGKLNATVYFVLFDQEETGLDGSAAFVKNYYIPNVLRKRGAVHVGAYITDMVLLYDPSPNSQTLPDDVRKMVPEAYKWIKDNSFRGDFICVWARKGVETELAQVLKNAYEERNPNGYKILVMDIPIPADMGHAPWNIRMSTFSRSDHASFWASSKFNSQVKTLEAMLLSDLGPWRGYQRSCYHKSCDNTVQLTQQNLSFMAQLINSVKSSILRSFEKQNLAK